MGRKKYSLPIIPHPLIHTYPFASFVSSLFLFIAGCIDATRRAKASPGALTPNLPWMVIQMRSAGGARGGVGVNQMK
jgi:hypothetical protein